MTNKTRYILVGAVWLGLLINGFVMSRAQDIPGHEEIEFWIGTTYEGPRDAIEYELNYQLDTMREFPSIFCGGEFEFAYLEESESFTRVVCHYDWTPGGGEHD